MRTTRRAISKPFASKGWPPRRIAARSPLRRGPARRRPQDQHAVASRLAAGGSHRRARPHHHPRLQRPARPVQRQRRRQRAPATAVLPDGKPIAVLCSQIEQATLDPNGSQGFAASLDSPAPARRSWTYNARGQVLTATDARDNTTTYTYHESTTADAMVGDLQSVTNPAGDVTTFDLYGRSGLLLRSTDASGTTTTLAYDARKRLTAVTVSSNGVVQTTSYTYNASGDLTRIVLPDGRTIASTYDEARRLTSVTDPAGNTVTYTLDNAGNRIGEQVRDASGTLALDVARAFDALDRAYRISFLPLAGQTNEAMTWTFARDALGNLTTVTDPNGNATTMAYDRLARMTALTQPPPTGGSPAPVISMGYDGRDQPLQVTDPRLLSTTYTHDGLGNRRAVASPDAGTASATFDAMGHVTSRTDARGTVQHYTYDSLNRPTQVTDASGGVLMRFEYDGGTSPAPYSKGRLTKITDESGSTSYAYDGFGHVLTKTQVTKYPTRTQAVAYTWGTSGQTNGKLVAITYPSGTRVNFGYDGGGRSPR